MKTHGIIRPHIVIFQRANTVRRRLHLNWNGFLQHATAYFSQFNNSEEIIRSLAGKPEDEFSSVMAEDNGKEL